MTFLIAPRALALLFSLTCLTAVQTRAELVPLNLALDKPATASASEAGHEPAHAVDGDGVSRWCASDESAGHWWQVDLGQPQVLTACRIYFEFDGARYRYRIEGSGDGKAWTMLVDRTGPDAPPHREQEHRLSNAKDVRFVRVTFTGLEEGRWASFHEFEVFGREMVDASRVVKDKSAGLLREIKAPAGMKVTLFAAPPDVSYPVCLAAAPNGDVFVAVDPNGSLDQNRGRGRIIRCRDTDGDGDADEFKIFAKIDSPRGMVWDGSTGTMYVVHPPFVSAFHDDNGDGVSDRNEVLVEGLGFDLGFRGADHTTNGVQVGIDGWLYVAVGDYGFVKATGRDGKSLQLHGGGVVRLRPDGTRLQIVSRGQRNIYDVAVSPTLDLFTRDNTNDGDGWDERLSHVVAGAQFGYPSRFKNFPDETAKPLAEYGQGSPTGSIWLDEPGVARGLFTCDWGTNSIDHHPLTHSGASFKATRDVFIQMPRPIDIDVDAQSRLYVASWRGGGFAYSGPDVGYVVRVVDPSHTPAPLIDVKSATEGVLRKQLGTESHVRRLAAQREILRRGVRPGVLKTLAALAADDDRPLEARVAAVFTLAQLGGRDVPGVLRALRAEDAVREHVIRALSDLGIATEADLVEALGDANPRVRLQAVAAVNSVDLASKLIPRLGDADPLVAHVAETTLTSLRVVDECFAALDDDARRGLAPGVIRVLQSQHTPAVVDGLAHRLHSSADPARRRLIFTALCRLHYREAEWTGGWWGTRPDTSGPYFQPVTWEQSARILETLRKSVDEDTPADAQTRRFMLIELLRHKVEVPGAFAAVVKLSAGDAGFAATISDVVSARATIPGDAVPLLAGVARSSAQPAAVRGRALSALCRTSEAFDAAVDVLATVSPDAPGELARVRDEFVRDARHAQNIDAITKLAQHDDAGQRELAFAILLQVATSKQSAPPAADAAGKAIDAAWRVPTHAASLLRAIGRERVQAYADQVRARVKDGDSAVREAAAFAASRLAPTDDAKKVLISALSFEQTVATVAKDAGDAKLGAELFVKQGCTACHTVAKSEPPKGPYLGGIATRYSRAELAESILKPSAKITQGFVTHAFQTKKREVVEGFIVRESGDEVEVRGATGVSTVLKTSDIARKRTLSTSIMPEQLVDNLSPQELASLLAYLESLKAD